MFERYTEKARRVIFFARYEASTFGSPYIESQHLLLGILREDKALANQFLKTHAAIEAIRAQIESQTVKQPSTSTSVDLPLSHECKRVLAYAAEESERLRHAFISPGHLFLALLREEKSMASTLLRERGLDAASVREELARSTAESPGPSAYELPPDLTNLLAQLVGLKGITVAKNPTVGASRPEVAIYEGEGVLTDGEILGDEHAPLPDKPSTPAEELALIHQRIRFLVKSMENAIANHQFEKARFYSDEERKERENLRILMERHSSVPGVTLPKPFLCIEIVRNEPFSVMQRRIDVYLGEGVAQVWTLDLQSKRAYTSTRESGLREVKGNILRLAEPPIELDLSKIS